MKRVLLIGGSGSLGKGIAERIKSSMDLTLTYRAKRTELPEVKEVYLDITDERSFEALELDYGVVVFVAGAMPANMKGYRPQEYIDANITGAHNVLEFCRKKKVKKLIYVMTFSDVSSSFYSGVPIREEDPRTINYVGDHAVYAISKIAACELIEHYHQEYGLQTIVFRIPTIYCNDTNTNYYVDGVRREKAYVSMIRSIVEKNRVEVWGDPSNAKDMPYIKDFARLIELAIEHPSAQGLFNAGTGVPITLTEFVNTAVKVFGGGDVVETVSRTDMPSQPNFTFDMSKAKRVFGYVPQYSLVEMLEDIKESANVWS